MESKRKRKWRQNPGPQDKESGTMFSERLKQYAQKAYDERLPRLGAVGKRTEAEMAACGAEEQVLMKFLYGTMPLRDAGEYDFSVFLGFVKHSLMVYRTIEWCRQIPEDIFLHHILYYRVNTENIEDCRRFFYDQLQPRIKGLSAGEAALEINYWCAENGTYEASDNRTISPMTLYRSGKGRCGEESTFAVTAFRSVGIPARQVYTPWWAHCDDNHAWVEVYVDGGWHFLGACEPEPILDRGWFTNASSRAMLVHTRTFSDFSCQADERRMGRDGLLTFYNETADYGITKAFEITVSDQEGKPVEDALVSIEILNMAEYCSGARLYTDRRGKAPITAGLGDLHIWVTKDLAGEAGNKRLWGEAWASVKNTDGSLITLKEVEGKPGEPNFQLNPENCWADVDVEAPSDYPMHPAKPSPEQREENRRRILEANRLRTARLAGYFDREKAALYPGEEELLRLAGGNFADIFTFLSRDTNPDRAALLHSLPVKDYKDAKAEILESHLEKAAPYRKEWEDKGRPEIYVKYILCPRLLLEEMTDYRGFILDFFSSEEKAEFKRNPAALWNWIESHIGYEPLLDYKTICAAPSGCLRLLQGNPLSRKLLFAAVLRTLGVPARLNPVNLEAEVFTDDNFIKISGLDCEENDRRCGEGSLKAGGIGQGRARLTLFAAGQDSWSYFRTWTIGKLMVNRYVTLDYTGISFEAGSLSLELEPGTYRVITTSRLPNGNQQASQCVFQLKAEEEKELSLRLRAGELGDLLVSNVLEDFVVEEEGLKTVVSSLLEGGANILAFLSEGEEPTEHVLNEMLEQKNVLNRLLGQNGAVTRILFVLRSKAALKNATVKAVLEAIPGIRTVICDFDETVEPLARRMYTDPDKLPLLLVTNPGLTAIYGCSGYHVGSVDLMVKLLELGRK